MFCQSYILPAIILQRIKVLLYFNNDILSVIHFIITIVNVVIYIYINAIKLFFHCNSSRQDI